MTPSTIIGIVEDHARAHTKRRDDADQALYACGDQLLALEHQVAHYLSTILDSRHAPKAQETERALRERQHAYTRLLEQLAREENAAHQALSASRSTRAYQMQMQAQVEEGLVQSADYARLLQQRDVALSALRTNRANAREILEECDSKLPEFDQHAAYAYLRKRQYDTEHYRQRRLLRLMDDWLAQRINYRLNRENEGVLLQMRAHVQARDAQDEQAAQALEERIAQQREQALRKAGMPGLAAKQLILAHQRVAARSRAEDAYAELKPLVLGEDTWHLNVRQSLAQQLSGRPLTQALARALDAMRPGDPGLERLQAFASRLHDLQQQLTTTRHRRELACQACDLVISLEDAVRAHLLIDVECEPDCNCNCHLHCHCDECCDDCDCDCHIECACDFNYDSDDRYTDSMDFEHLIAGYVNSDITLDHVLEIIDEQRIDTAEIDATAPRQHGVDPALNEHT